MKAQTVIPTSNGMGIPSFVKGPVRGAEKINLHRALMNWGEGTSNAALAPGMLPLTPGSHLL
jgi:hypothetical protein